MTMPDALVLVEREMERVDLFPFCGGHAAFFSRPSPEKTSANEDSALVLPLGPRAGILAVADGLGGARGGKQASSMVVWELCAAAEQHAAGDRSLRETILTGIDAANREIQALGIGAGATFAAVEIDGRRLRPYHVGDCEILVAGGRGKIKLQTISHSPVSYAVHSGLLDEREALHHEDRHIVFNAIGVPDMRIELGAEIELLDQDTVLVACDGLFDNLTTAEIVGLLCQGTLEEAANDLITMASERMRGPQEGHPSKPDDLTMLVFRPGASE